MLTPEEQKELQALQVEEAEAQRFLAKEGPNPENIQGNLTPEEIQELNQLQAEEDAANKFMAENPQVAESPILRGEEADLGFSTRAKYSLEPLQSNRKALLIEKFGADNVKEDKKGDLYIRQAGAFRPVNIEGLSFTDVTDFLGATPEMAGAAIGGIAGLGAGAVGAVPAAIAGGAAGSAARQGLSALLGTPQVADLGERAKEVGISAAFSGAGAGLGKAVKGVAKKFLPKHNIDDAFKEMAKKIGMVDDVAPTRGQIAGGRTLDIEKQLGETPFFGRKIRKTVNKQVQKVKDNLADEFGEFRVSDLDIGGAGSSIREMAEKSNKAIKTQAGELFDKLAAQGDNISVNSKVFNTSLNKNLGKLRLFDQKGNPLKHSAKSGLTADQFSRVQSVMQRVNETIKESGDQLNVNDVNILRKFIDENIKEGAAGQVMDNGNRRLVQIRESFMDLTENMLGAQDKKLKREFRAARGLWAKYLNNKGIIEKGKGLNLKNLADEKIIDRIFKDSKNVKMLKEILPEEQVKQAGDNYIKKLLKAKLGDSEQWGAKGVLNTIEAKKEAITEALGKESYEKLVSNLKFLDRVGKPFNPSKTAVTELRTNLLRGALLRGEKAAREVIERGAENLPQIGQGLSGLLSDPYQREFAESNNKVPYRPR